MDLHIVILCHVPGQVRTRAVALTVPAYTAADLLRRDCPDASAALKSLDYPPVAAVTLAYPMSALRQDRLDAARKLPGAAVMSLAVGLCWGCWLCHPCVGVSTVLVYNVATLLSRDWGPLLRWVCAVCMS